VTLLQILVVLAVVAAVGAVAAGAVRGGLPDVESSVAQAPLPQGPLTAADLAAVRFSVGLRGYRMDEVDAVLDRMSAELVERDAEIERLRGTAEIERLRGTAEAEPPLRGG
jgi:DivIVA domain-containing protein